MTLQEFPLLRSFRDNLFAMSMVRVAISLLSVNSCNAVAEYAGLEISLFRSIKASLISKVLQNNVHIKYLIQEKVHI